MRRKHLILIGLILLSVRICFGQADVTPPVLLNFSFSPTSINTDNPSQSITFTAQASDDLRGVGHIGIMVESPTAINSNSGSADTLTSGTTLNGTFQGSMTFSQYLEPGTWKVTSVYVTDGLNDSFYDKATLAGMGFPTTFENTGSLHDTTQPQLLSFGFSPNTINTDNPNETITFTARGSDDLRGVGHIGIMVESPTGANSNSGSADTLTSGTSLNGTFQGDMGFPQYQEPGIWRVTSVMVTDGLNDFTYDTSALATMDFPTTFQNIGGVHDVTAPTLTAFDFSPINICTVLREESITFTASAQDDTVGVGHIGIQCEGPTGRNSQSGSVDNLVGGTSLDGDFEGVVSFTRYLEEGWWDITSVYVTDGFNDLFLNTQDLINRGYSYQFLNGFIPGTPQAEISVPKSGKSIRGNNVTIKAILISGSPEDVSSTLGVRFEYRQLPAGTFQSIPAANPGNPNPDITYPYLMQWDVSSTSGLSEGDYALRAVAHDTNGIADDSPSTISITIDRSDAADITENASPSSSGGKKRFAEVFYPQSCQIKVSNTSESSGGSASISFEGIHAEVTIPAGALQQTNDTMNLSYQDPQNYQSYLTSGQEHINAFINISLQSSQVDLLAGKQASINIYYPDSNQDGIVDGTSVSEAGLKLQVFNSNTNVFEDVEASIPLTVHNFVHGLSSHFSVFALIETPGTRVDDWELY